VFVVYGAETATQEKYLHYSGVASLENIEPTTFESRVYVVSADVNRDNVKLVLLFRAVGYLVPCNQGTVCRCAMQYQAEVNIGRNDPKCSSTKPYSQTERHRAVPCK